MQIELKRHWFTEKSTSGIVKVDGTWFCFSLEDVARADGVKIPGVTCIPLPPTDGKYKVILDLSTRFKKIMPHVLNVPLFSGIRIHPGNDEVSTEGCILVGCERTPDHVWRSMDAFNALFIKMKEAVDRGEEIDLVITNEPL